MPPSASGSICSTNQHPHKVLAFKDPFEAITKILSPTTILTVGDLYDKYVAWAAQSLPPLRDGRKNPDLIKVERLGKFLDPFRSWAIADFGPDELRGIQESLVKYRYYRTNHEEEPVAYTRTGINQLVNQIHKIFLWGMGRDLVSAAQRQRLKEIQPLRFGKTAAKDKSKRTQVTAEEFSKVVANVNSVVGDMMQLMWLTAMRPGEVCRMRPFDIIRSSPDCWLYIPGRDAGPVGDHKTAYHRRVRAIPLAGAAQKILGRRIEDPQSMAHLFSPAGAMEELRAKRFAVRETPVGQGNEAGTNRQPHPMINPGTMYHTEAFSNAVKRGCNRAGVVRFTPYDLRRSAATRVRAALDKDAAKLLLGHVSTDTTEIYLLEEVQEAMKVALKLEPQPAP